MRLLATLGAVAIALGTMTGVALGGGSVWHFDGYYHPGDTVVSTTAVAWGHNRDLGHPKDGPYLIYLVAVDPAPQDRPRPDEGMLVGIVDVHLGGHTGEDGSRYGPHHAVARFEIPDVPAGVYEILHCNDPCTTTLGDLVGGWDLRVLDGEYGRPADEIAGEVRERLATAPLIMPASAPTTARDESEEAGTSGATAAPIRVAPLSEEPPRPVSTTRQGFNGLWLQTVAGLAALAAIRLVRAEWNRYRLSPGEWNASAARDVLTDE